MIKDYVYKNSSYKSVIEAVQFIDKDKIITSLYKLLDKPMQVSFKKDGLFLDLGYDIQEIKLYDFVIRHNGGKITVISEQMFNNFFIERVM